MDVRNYGFHYSQKIGFKMVEQDITPFILECKSNNWLKFHGYPMRRGKRNSYRKDMIKARRKRGLVFDETPQMFADTIPPFIRVVGTDGHKKFFLKGNTQNEKSFD